MELMAEKDNFGPPGGRMGSFGGGRGFGGGTTSEVSAAAGVPLPDPVRRHNGGRAVRVGELRRHTSPDARPGNQRAVLTGGMSRDQFRNSEVFYRVLFWLLFCRQLGNE